MKIKTIITAVVFVAAIPVIATAQGISDRGQSGSSQTQRNAYAIITQSIVNGTEEALWYAEIKNIAKRKGPASLADWCAGDAPGDAMDACVYLAVEKSSRPYQGWEVGNGRHTKRQDEIMAEWASGLGALAYVAHDFYRHIGEQLSQQPFSSMAAAKESIRAYKQQYFEQYAKVAFRKSWPTFSTGRVMVHRMNSEQPVEARINSYKVAAGSSGVSLTQHGVTLFDSKEGVVAGTTYTFTIEQNRSQKAQESSAAQPKSSLEEKRKIQGLMGG